MAANADQSDRSGSLRFLRVRTSLTMGSSCMRRFTPGWFTSRWLGGMSRCLPRLLFTGFFKRMLKGW